MMDFLTDLNSKQQEAMKRTEGFVRVIAGAGNGKAKLLVSRYAYLVSICGVDPKNILCVQKYELKLDNASFGSILKRIARYMRRNLCVY